MAKGIDINGTLRGKRGGVVYYRRAGEQNSRVKVTPANPKTAKQAVQRMVLATASKIASALEPIVDHSFQGVDVGSKSVQAFRSQAMNYLRSVAGSYFNTEGSVDAPAIFAIKGAPAIGAAAGMFISRGTLGVNGYSFSSKILSVSLSSALSTQAFTTQAAYAAELAKLGIEPGDQLTFVLVLRNPNQVVATMSYENGTKRWENHAQEVKFCRIVFVPTLPENFSGTLVDGGSINAALIKESYGGLPSISTSATLIGFNFTELIPTGYDALMGTYIRSQKQENGTFKYSSAHFEPDYSEFDWNEADPVYLSYMDGVTEINVGDTLYLRHAVAAPFA